MVACRTRRTRSTGLVALAVIAIFAAGCAGGGPAPTAGGGSTSTPTAAAAPPTATPTQAATPAPLAKLDLLWESAGVPAATGKAPATYSPAIDPLTGDIWVAVSFDGTIWIFGEDGAFKGTFGKPGKGDGEFNFIRPTCTPCGAGALAFAPDGTLFVADVGNQRIQKFDAKHRFVKAWGSFGDADGQFADANQIATDGSSVYVVDDARQDLQVFDMNGTFVRRIAGGAGWLAVDPSGALYASNAVSVKKYAAGAASVAATYNFPDYPNAERIGLAADGKGRLYFDVQNIGKPYITRALVEFDIATGSVREWDSGGETIAVPSDGGVIYVANFVNPTWPTAALRKYAIAAP